MSTSHGRPSRHARVGRILVAVACAAMVSMASALAGTAGSARAAGADHGGMFSLVVIPDTQIAVQEKSELFYAQTQWIVEHAVDRDIAFVIHLGDVVEWPDRESDWVRAERAMDRLDGVVPYAVAVGNHDLDAWSCTPWPNCTGTWEGIEDDRSTTLFNTHFPRSLFASMPSFGGSYPEARSDNAFFTFAAGGVDWLVLTCKFRPTDAELAWAEGVVASHPDRQVILVTHEYQNGSSRTPTGERIWDEIAGEYANVKFVLSGHFSNPGRRVDVGADGNRVYQIVADYQTYDPTRVNENSYLRIMRFEPESGRVSVRTYSPYCDATGLCPAFKTDPANQFTLRRVEFEDGDEGSEGDEDGEDSEEDGEPGVVARAVTP